MTEKRTKTKSKKKRRTNVYVQGNVEEISSRSSSRGSVLTKFVPGDRRAVRGGRAASPSALRQNVARSDIFTKNLGLELKKFLILTGITVTVLIVLAIVLNLT